MNSNRQTQVETGAEVPVGVPEVALAVSGELERRDWEEQRRGRAWMEAGP